MRSDQLSEVFELVEVRGQMTGAFEVYGPWRSQHEIGDPLKLIAMVHGHGRLLADGLDTPIELGPGEVAILNGRSWLRIEGGTGDGPVCEFLPGPGYNSYGHDDADGPPDVVVGGHIEVNHVGRTLLAQALPPVGHVRAAEASALHRNLRLLAEEAGAGRVGSAFAIRQYAQLLVLELLRAYVDQADLPPGWLRVMTDERLSPALTLMHGEPGRPWSLEELARAAAMSRTSFAERFRTLAGGAAADVPRPVADAAGAAGPARRRRTRRVAGRRAGLRVGERVQHRVQARGGHVAPALPLPRPPGGRAPPRRGTRLNTPDRPHAAIP
ncbi:AraC family transcriptional regulator [Nonomuraea salmonea]|uniref:AraC family transcriptional regulator n=1 Tax=Nonomuraea salmonea TaxID=46181 RepID=UPI002FE6F98F